MSLYLGENLISGTNVVTDKSERIGQIIQSTIPLTDAGLHLLDGALFQGNGSYSEFVTYIAGLVSTYPNLFETEANWQDSVTNYGVCGKFVYDSVNNTVRLPKVTGIIEGTTDVAALGDLVEAGLPNITGGSVSQIDTRNSGTPPSSQVTDGCLFYENSTKIGVGSGSSTYTAILKLDASRSSSIYGNSSTVQPQTIKAFYYIVIATTTKTDIQVDIDEIATDLNGKADTDLTNTTPSISFATAMNTAGIRTVVETYVNGTSWYRVYSDGWCEQGGRGTFAHNTKVTVNLAKEYVNTSFNVVLNSAQAGFGSAACLSASPKTTSQIEVFNWNTASASMGIYWRTEGYIR